MGLAINREHCESTVGKTGAGPGLLSGEGDDIFPPDHGFLGRLSYALLSLFKPNCWCCRDAQGLSVTTLPEDQQEVR